MHRLTTISRCAAALLAFALISNDCALAVIERTVVLSITGNQQNQLAVQGTLNTLAQGLNIVPFNNNNTHSVGIEGTLTANLGFEVHPSGPSLVSVDFVGSELHQTGVNLSYLVPGTNRTVSFTTSGVNFSLSLPAISSDLGTALLQSSISTGMCELVQNQGTAEISITNRPSKMQQLATSPVVAAASGGPSLDDFDIQPLGGIEYSVDFTLPVDFQQVLFSGVGLPVSLNYSGALRLVGTVSIIPEPSVMALVAGATMLLCVRGRAIR